MNAEYIALQLGGRKVGSGWSAPCPAHEDHKPSLSINENDGRVLVYCHAGCHQREVIDALRTMGLWGKRGAFKLGLPVKPKPKVETADGKAGKNLQAANAIWNDATPTTGTPVEDYLASRNLYLPETSDLRFHPGLKHPSGGIWPCMVARVTSSGSAAAMGIHRTFLAKGSAGKAPVARAKMMLGPCSGGVVRLKDAHDLVMIGEGIETCLAAMQATGLPAWAALSASGLPALVLPKSVRKVIILADADAPGEKAARAAAIKWAAEKREVRIARPPQGKDFNDMLLTCGTENPEAVS
jgi:hypothetical protein